MASCLMCANLTERCPVFLWMISPGFEATEMHTEDHAEFREWELPPARELRLREVTAEELKRLEEHEHEPGSPHAAEHKEAAPAPEEEDEDEKKVREYSTKTPATFSAAFRFEF